MFYGRLSPREHLGTIILFFFWYRKIPKISPGFQVPAGRPFQVGLFSGRVVGIINAGGGGYFRIEICVSRMFEFLFPLFGKEIVDLNFLVHIPHSKTKQNARLALRQGTLLWPILRLVQLVFFRASAT